MPILRREDPRNRTDANPGANEAKAKTKPTKVCAGQTPASQRPVCIERIKSHGGNVIAQDKATSADFSMPNMAPHFSSSPRLSPDAAGREGESSAPRKTENHAEKFVAHEFPRAHLSFP
jgi:hypothetical protein